MLQPSRGQHRHTHRRALLAGTLTWKSESCTSASTWGEQSKYHMATSPAAGITSPEKPGKVQKRKWQEERVIYVYSEEPAKLWKRSKQIHGEKEIGYEDPSSGQIGNSQEKCWWLFKRQECGKDSQGEAVMRWHLSMVSVGTSSLTETQGKVFRNTTRKSH